jgi:hypothetical protein
VYGLGLGGTLSLIRTMQVCKKTPLEDRMQVLAATAWLEPP